MSLPVKPIAIDLFCGAGGMSLGLRRAGFDVSLSADFWRPAVETFRANNPFERIIEADLGKLEPENLASYGIMPGMVDLVAGGPPCQGFSIQRIGSDSDPRNSLVLSFAEYVKWISPKMFLMENVPGLIGKRGSELVRNFESRMKESGYGLVHGVVDAANFGVPQRRRRVVFVGWKISEGLGEFILPNPKLMPHEFRTVKEAIGDLAEPPSDYSPLPGDPLHRRMRISPLNQERLRFIPPGGGFEDLPVDLRVSCHKNGADRIGHRNVYGRLHPDKPASTITARFDSFTRGQFAHPFENRNISLREGARLQTFPDTYTFKGTQEEITAQIGNAVPPVLAEALGHACMDYLTRRRIVDGPTLNLFQTPTPLLPCPFESETKRPSHA
jgi:DNA (cytosine-5)-methyltransferase 1